MSRSPRGAGRGTAGRRRGDPGDRGQGLVEFGLILALIVLVAVVTLVFFSPQLSWVLSLIGVGIERTS